MGALIRMGALIGIGALIDKNALLIWKGALITLHYITYISTFWSVCEIFSAHTNLLTAL